MKERKIRKIKCCQFSDEVGSEGIVAITYLFKGKEGKRYFEFEYKDGKKLYYFFNKQDPLEIYYY